MIIDLARIKSIELAEDEKKGKKRWFIRIIYDTGLRIRGPWIKDFDLAFNEYMKRSNEIKAYQDSVK